MARGRVMSRADFVAGVEKLLGRFDSDSFMRGFKTGYERALSEVGLQVQDPSYDFTRLNVQTRLKKLEKRKK
jgi:hypothetical protein